MAEPIAAYVTLVPKILFGALAALNNRGQTTINYMRHQAIVT